MKTRLKLTAKQFDALNIGTRRSMIYQLLFIDAPKYQYSLVRTVSGGQWSDMSGNMPEKLTKKLRRLLINGYEEEVIWENYT